MNRVADLGVCRLEPFDAEAIPAYPIFRDVSSAPIEQGMSVCRLGFPFCDVPASYNEERNEFVLDERAFPVPRFALDGIVARFNRRVRRRRASRRRCSSRRRRRGFAGRAAVRSSTRRGACAASSRTRPTSTSGSTRSTARRRDVVTERQFLNVGAATHVDEVACAAESAERRIPARLTSARARLGDDLRASRRDREGWCARRARTGTGTAAAGGGRTRATRGPAACRHASRHR